ncbi:nucleic acid dioxygenase ALKBH1 [Macrosteles quadrilineatus]|uniref:nucleic acid dioxygenase ALKBH1 n=1 Tax=Macrosteles quadrilineatus TaxID=74068 RepID=UPI0023E18BD6|nr:nucleic acid dioxygenase ALKBH1 [Macrosteles quadrilineatus]
MFREKFKFYKSRCPPPTFENVIDFSSLSTKFSEKVILKKPCNTKNQAIPQHLTSIEQWKIYELKDSPGIIFIVNPFTSQGQQYWVERCLKHYTRKPNKLNLDPFDDLQAGENWWEKAHVNCKVDGKLLKKLRWATLGYHHNWDTKVYSDADRGEFPSDLAELSEVIVEAIGEAHHDYRAEAAIINFYHFDSTLSGHKDVSEPNMESPLLSISFGQSAVFLVGGESLNDPVTAMMLHSGDVVVMSGHSRKCYHGVPRIIPTSSRPWVGQDWETTDCGKYLETSRININIRQVLLPGQKRINR